jgi:hypothetical protein
MSKPAKNQNRWEQVTSTKKCLKYQTINMTINQKEKPYFKNNNYLQLSKKIIKISMVYKTKISKL